MSFPTRLFVPAVGLLLAALSPSSGAEAPGQKLQDQGRLVAGDGSRFVDVRFADDSSARVLAGQVTGLAPDGASALQGVLDLYSVRSVRPVFGLPEATLARLRAEGQARTGRKLPDLRRWVRFELPLVADVDRFLKSMTLVPGVEVVEPAPVPSPPPAVTPSFVANQGYIVAPTGGIGAQAAWQVPGGNAGNVTVFDVEYNWLQSHEDLTAAAGLALLLDAGDSNSPPGFDGCPAPCDRLNREHGTAVLGELIGDNDAKGVTGIAWGAGLGLAPARTTNLGYNLGHAIALAAAAGSAGDVILIEQQTTVCGLADGSYGPSEWAQSVFDAIQAATSAGIVVVEAAGNGSVDLDQTACGDTFDRSVRDSGAIIVGAGQPPASGNDREREGFSSYGGRVDVQSWGSRIWSTGYGDGYVDGDDSADADRWYTDTFGGTSGASPMVTGAAAILQSISIDQSGSPLTPGQIRTLLVDTGSPQQGDTSEHIGPRPDLVAAVATLIELPAADAGLDQQAECAGPDGTPVAISGSGSDPNGLSVACHWSSASCTFADADACATTATCPLGTNTVTLTVNNGFEDSAPDPATITIVDTTPPTGGITGPPDGTCFGPGAIPAVVSDDFSDVCDDALSRSYNPLGGPAYFDHGDYHVTLTATDDSGLSAQDAVDFTIDLIPPTVTFLAPTHDQLALPPVTIPIRIQFAASDDDGASGGILHEVIKLQGCVIYDGDTEGNRDGLLSDEFIQLTKYNLCQFMARCGFTVLQYPTIRVESTDDCGGNTGFADRIIRKRLLKTEVCPR